MKPHPLHAEILQLIKENSGTATQHTFLDHYLGSTHYRYPINLPTLRIIAKEWTSDYHHLPANDFAKLLTSLVRGKSHTEKIFVGILLDYASNDQRKFDPALFDKWLDHLEGWAEIDAMCSGKFSSREIPGDWARWKKQLGQLSKSKNINKRRASIVFLVAPLRKARNEAMLAVALQNVDRLKSEKEILITKAISWVLRSAIGHHKEEIKKYVALNKESLPKIAVRETLTKLITGRKTKPRE
jgi:3-methyladenine DNA glycosylase AlkD